MLRKSRKILLGVLMCVISIWCSGNTVQAEGVMEESCTESLELAEGEEPDIVGEITSEDGEWEYKILTDGTAQIIRCLKYDLGAKVNVLEIPSVIDGITVTSVKKISVQPQKLIFPETVTRVGDMFVYNLERCNEVIVKEGNNRFVVEDGILYTSDTMEMIWCARNKTDLVIPEGIVKLGHYSLHGCYDLETIEFSSTVTNISSINSYISKIDATQWSSYAFGTLPSLQSISVDPDNTRFTSINGMLCTKDETELVLCPPTIKDLVIPEGITIVWEFVHDLNSIEYPFSVTRIINSVSVDTIVVKNPKCTIELVRDVNLVKGWDNSEAQAYATENSLTYESLGLLEYDIRIKKDGTVQVVGILNDNTKVVLPNEIIGRKVSGVGGLTDSEDENKSRFADVIKITLPEGVVSVDDYAFINGSLRYINLPTTLNRIGAFAFAGCENLKRLELPKSVTYVDKAAFSKGNYKSDVGEGWLTLTVYNPECEIYDNENTLFYVKTIIGYINSPAHDYALKYDKEFIDIENIFADVSVSGWEFPYAKWAVENNVMVGKGTDEYGRIIFGPSQNLTREQFVQVLYNNSGRPSVADVENKFSDVKDDWYTNAVLWASKEGIVSGYPNGKFGVGEDITREQLALMLYRYAEMYDYDMAVTEGLHEQFADGTKVSDWAENAVNWAITQGIISGKGTGSDLSKLKIDPQGAATRAECAAMMMKLLNKNS